MTQRSRRPPAARTGRRADCAASRARTARSCRRCQIDPARPAARRRSLACTATESPAGTCRGCMTSIFRSASRCIASAAASGVIAPPSSAWYGGRMRVPHGPQLGRRRHQPAVFQLGERCLQRRVGCEQRICLSRSPRRQHPQLARRSAAARRRSSCAARTPSRRRPLSGGVLTFSE